MTDQNVPTLAPDAVPQLSLDGVSVSYGDAVVLHEVSLDVREGEFVTLLGPSGCGKTSLLRTVSGFSRVTTGRVRLRGEDVTSVPAHRRPVNMVFQRPTLFPHLDVARNIAFGLRLSGLPKDEIADRVAEGLRLVRLTGMGRRRSHELSGGQLQRVVMARALVKRPQVLLLDEPLSALDLKIRLEMEEELRRVHRESGTTFLYVTHDQGEALSMSDRIVVLNAGRIEQEGSPDEIYHRPSSSFVASFVGGANVLPVQIVRDGAGATVTFPEGLQFDGPATSLPSGPARLVLRPEDLTVSADGEGLRGVLLDVAFRGASVTLRIDVPALGCELRADVTVRAVRGLDVGAAVRVAWDAGHGSLLAAGDDAPEPPR